MGIKAQVFRQSDLQEVDRGNLKVADYFDTPEFEAMSLSRIVKLADVTDCYTDRDMVDYVIEGEGTCVINGEVQSVKAGDVVVLPRGTQFTWSAGVTLLAISHPRFQ